MRHHDTDHDHVHVVASRVYLDKDEEGRPVGALTVDDWQDYKRGMDYLRGVERTYGLHQVADYALYTSTERRPERLEYRLRERKGREKIDALKAAGALGDPEAKRKALAGARELEHRSVRQRLREWIGASVEAGESASELVEKLEDRGVGVRANIQSTGRVAGLSFELDGVSMKSSSVARAYSWGKLKKAGLGYEAARDLPTLRAATERSYTTDKRTRDEREARQDARRDRPARAGGPESGDSGRTSNRAGHRGVARASGAVGDGRSAGGPGAHRADGAPNRHRRDLAGGRARSDENQQSEFAASLNKPDGAARRAPGAEVTERGGAGDQGADRRRPTVVPPQHEGHGQDGRVGPSALASHQPDGVGGGGRGVGAELGGGDVEPASVDARLVSDRGTTGQDDERGRPADDRARQAVREGLVGADTGDARDAQRDRRLDLPDADTGAGEVDRLELEAAKQQALKDLAEAEKPLEQRAAERDRARQAKREEQRVKTKDKGRGFER